MGEVINLSKQTVNLSKSETINLSKSSASPKLKKIQIGLGWDPIGGGVQATEVTRYKVPGIIAKFFSTQTEIVKEVVGVKKGLELDLDAWLVVAQKGLPLLGNNVIYYHNKEWTANGTTVIRHHGDNLTGEGEAGSDKEQISVSLHKIPEEYNNIIVGVTIYKGRSKGQSFNDVNNTFIRIVDKETNFEICRFTSKDIVGIEDELPRTFIAGVLNRVNGDWEFTAIGRCTEDDLISDAVRRLNIEGLEY